MKRQRTSIVKPVVRRPSARFSREGADRRALRRVAGVLCLLLALYCLITASATLHAQTPSAEPDPRTSPEPPRHRLPLLIPLLFLVLVVILAAVAQRGRRTRVRRAESGQEPTTGAASRSETSARR